VDLFVDVICQNVAISLEQFQDFNKTKKYGFTVAVVMSLICMIGRQLACQLFGWFKSRFKRNRIEIL